jgi:HSP20 family protein
MTNWKTGRETVDGKRFLTAAELEEWSKAEAKVFWAPICEVVDNVATVKLIVDLPGCSARDIQIALLPGIVILKKKVSLLASRNWNEFWQALLGPSELFRRFDLPASIDVNRVKAELEMGVLTVIAPKLTAHEQPAKGAPGRPHAFAA